MKTILLSAGLSLLAFTASAQSSADDLIGQLKLHPGGATRGIHALPVPSSAPEAAISGVPHARPVAAHPMAARPGAAEETAPQGEANLTVQFETGSDRLTPAARKTLAELGRALASSELAGDKFQIVGHTDSVGAPGVNQSLSERRAQVVVAFIATNYGVERSRLTAIGKGESEPLVPTGAGVPEPRNRRVQIINMGT